MKQIKVESCEECPLRYRLMGDVQYEHYCNHSETDGMQLDNIKIIHPDCKLESLTEWIKTSEQLPEIGEEVNVLMKDGIVTSLYRKAGREGATDYFWDHHYDGSEIYLAESIIAWQPLPAPPKEDEG